MTARSRAAAIDYGRAPAAEAAIDPGYARSVIERMAAIGSSPLGFRVAGTPEDLATAELVAGELDAIGLEDVRLEPVTVDAWRFRGATLEAGGRTYTCATFGGAPPTPPGGVAGELVDGGTGSRRELARGDVRGRIVLVDWRGDHLRWPAFAAAEAAHQGAVGVVVASLPGGAYYQGEGAIGTFDALWIDGAAPMATIAKEDALALAAAARDGGPVPARLRVDADLDRGATGWNVLGTLPGRREGAGIHVAAHHDAWFSAAFDDASGVAATLAMARAMRAAGHVPEHPIHFGSNTAEEYGLANSAFDWLIGAWSRFAHAHPDWGDELALYVNIEGTGTPFPLQVDAPAELRRFSRRICAGARRDGLLAHGVVYDGPRTGTDLWPAVACGAPGVSLQNLVTRYMREHYHTQLDDITCVDFGNFVAMTRLYTRFVVAADRAPEALLDPAARAAEVRARGGLTAIRRAGIATDRLEAALAAYEAAAGRPAGAPARRRAFAVLARALEALNARDKQSRLQAQALHDVDALDRGLAALRAGDRRGCVRALERCGRNRLAAHVSDAVFRADAARHRPGHPGFAWGAMANLTPSPDLWDELASLRRERGSRSDDGWVERSLVQRRDAAAAELEARVARLAEAFAGASRALGEATGSTRAA